MKVVVDVEITRDEPNVTIPEENYTVTFVNLDATEEVLRIIRKIVVGSKAE